LLFHERHPTHVQSIFILFVYFARFAAGLLVMF